MIPLPFSSEDLDQKPKKEISASRWMVQVFTSTQLVSTTDPKWQDIPYSIELKTEDGKFKYLAYGFANREEANQAKAQIKKLGFEDAFVVGYRDGVRK